MEGCDLEMNEVGSPCTGVCRLEGRTRWCVGCGRTASEIGRWLAIGTEEKAAIRAKLPARLAMLRRASRSG